MNKHHMNKHVDMMFVHVDTMWVFVHIISRYDLI